MGIPLTDLKLQYENIKDEMDSAINAVLNETDFILGHQVAILEEEIAKYSGTKFAIGVASGTDALVLSLAASGIVKVKDSTLIALSLALRRIFQQVLYVPLIQTIIAARECDRLQATVFDVSPNGFLPHSEQSRSLTNRYEFVRHLFTSLDSNYYLCYAILSIYK